MPTNLRIGAGYGLNNNPDNRLTLLRDVTKLLVPKVCLEGGAIKCGDLLVTSSRDPVWR